MSLFAGLLAGPEECPHLELVGRLKTGLPSICGMLQVLHSQHHRSNLLFVGPSSLTDGKRHHARNACVGKHSSS